MSLETCPEASNSYLEGIHTEEEGSFWSLGTDSPGRRTGSSKSEVDSLWNHVGTRDPWKLNMKPYRSPGSNEVHPRSRVEVQSEPMEDHPEATQARIEALDYHPEETKVHPAL